MFHELCISVDKTLNREVCFLFAALGYYRYRSWLDSRRLFFSNGRQGEESPGSIERDAG